MTKTIELPNDIAALMARCSAFTGLTEAELISLWARAAEDQHQAVRDAVQVGIDEADRGAFCGLTVEEIFDEALGEARDEPETITLKQPSSIVGTLHICHVIGDCAEVLVQQTDTAVHATMSVDLVRELGDAFNDRMIRVHGEGEWSRRQDGYWYLRAFHIQSYTVLEDQSLVELMDMLRAIPGNGWIDLEDPLKELADIRHGDETDA